MEKLLPLYVLSLDFGGTKLAAAIVDISSGKIIAHKRQPTPSVMGAEACLEAITVTGKEIISQFSTRDTIPLEIGNRIESVGISFGGPVSKDRQKVVRSMHVNDWDGFALPEKISSIFNLPSYMDNDANVAALGEWYFGAGRETSNMLYIQISTGIGSGIIINRQIYRGSGLAGEFGHLTTMPEGDVICSCGKKGCVESYSSGWAIAREGQKIVNSKSTDKCLLKDFCANDPKLLDAELIFQAYRVGDIHAKQIIEKALTCLSIGISNVICILDPERIVIGGGVAKAKDVIDPILQRILPKYLPPMFTRRYDENNKPLIRYSELHGTETLLGAALLTQGF